MKDFIKYYNHAGQLKLTLNKWPYFSEPGEFKNWTWGYDDNYGRIGSFYRNKESYPLLIGIAENYKTYRDALCEIFTADILAGKPGRLELRGWSLNCWITEAEYEYALSLDRQAVFKVLPVDPTWTRKSTKSYDGITSGGGDEDYGRDYLYKDDILGRDYNYGYNQSDSHYDEIELAGVGNGFEAVIYGPQDNPTIYLNNCPIKVNVSIDEDERLKIVSNGRAERSIKILQLDGTESDAFIYRDKENTPFIELGTYTELTYGEVKFDFTVIERRSEPSWI